MKKVVVMSDNHGNDSMMEYIKAQEPHADYYIHCGDSEASYKELLTGYICVKGNNDWSLDLPMEAKLQIEDVTLFITHGQYLGYFNRELAMKDLLIRNHCQVFISGHTHTPLFLKDGSYFTLRSSATDPGIQNDCKPTPIVFAASTAFVSPFLSAIAAPTV